MNENKSIQSRRKLLKTIAAGSSAVLAGKSLPDNWTKPIVDTVMLPAHAATTDDTGSLPVACSVPELLRIEFQDGYNASGTNPVITSIVMGPGEGATPELDDKDGRYITAWGYYADAPSTPVYINTDVFWQTKDKTVAYTCLPFNHQSSSFVSAPGNVGDSTIITASYVKCTDRTLGDITPNDRISASFTVNIELN